MKTFKFNIGARQIIINIEKVIYVVCFVKDSEKLMLIKFDHEEIKIPHDQEFIDFIESQK